MVPWKVLPVAAAEAGKAEPVLPLRQPAERANDDANAASAVARRTGSGERFS
jgi:hypothetical protein